jgi:ribonucleoside-triphosphate reductase (thioredoxin)
MNNYLPTDYQAFIHTSRYARWLEKEGRRETWGETVGRYMKNVVEPKLSNVAIPDLASECLRTMDEVERAILGLELMPSMRAVMTAGVALNRDNTAGYNCSYLPVDDPKSFDEAMFILLCGTGVGFSVERQFVGKLPDVPDQMFDSSTTVVVKDSKEGWAKALRQVIALLYSGEVPKWDVSLVRPAGAKLKTFGGRASGPAPLVELFNFVTHIFKGAKGRKLSSIECHDIMCKIGEVVVVGGVRRSAMISLSNLSDDRMRHAKSGNWWENNPQRALANNSVSYTEKPDAVSFMREWTALVESGSGERGIFNRQAAKVQAGKNGRRDPNYEFGTNPCSEIILRPYQFCNLTECVVRATDTVETLEQKVKLATILGTIQSTYTHFPYLRKIWQKNTEEERLLGVSLTGIMDNPLMTTKNERTGEDTCSS